MAHGNPASMALPEGRTCSDCGHIGRCRWLVGRKGDETDCDWDPSRFAWPQPDPAPKKGD